VKKKRVIIIDALNQFLRTYIVDPSLSSNGQPIGGLKGFFKVLQKLNREIKPDYIVVVWDGAGGSKKRKTMNKNYKAGRAPIRLNRNMRLTEEEEQNNKIWQLNRTMEYLNLCPVVQLIEEGVEADDIIALTCQMPRFKGWDKIIVSSDKDFFQLCDDETIVYRPTQSEVMNKNHIVEKFNVHPNNFALARSLVGDNSDNLPGIKGVGLPTVAKRLPFLREEKEYDIGDIEKYCKETESKVKFYETVLNNLDIVDHNLKMMQLSSPSISLQGRARVNWVFDNAYFGVNKTEFVKCAIQDGFGFVKFDELFALFHRIAIENKEVNNDNVK